MKREIATVVGAVAMAVVGARRSSSFLLTLEPNV